MDTINLCSFLEMYILISIIWFWQKYCMIFWVHFSLSYSVCLSVSDKEVFFYLHFCYFWQRGVTHKVCNLVGIYLYIDDENDFWMQLSYNLSNSSYLSLYYEFSMSQTEWCVVYDLASNLYIFIFLISCFVECISNWPISFLFWEIVSWSFYYLLLKGMFFRMTFILATEFMVMFSSEGFFQWHWYYIIFVDV